MTFFKKTALALALTGLATAPIAAQALDRPMAPAEGASEVGGDAINGLIIVALAGVGMAILLATDDDDAPTSP